MGESTLKSQSILRKPNLHFNSLSQFTVLGGWGWVRLGAGGWGKIQHKAPGTAAEIKRVPKK